MRTKNELYQEALRTIAARRQTARALAEDARAEAEAVIPALRHAEEEVRVRGIRCALAGASGKDRTAANAALTEAKQKLAALLAASGRPTDALEPKFTCKKCQDTGYVGAQKCECFQKLLRQAAFDALGAAHPQDCRFSNFSLDYYSVQPLPNGVVPREKMAMVKNYCAAYARDFLIDRYRRTAPPSLLFLGNTGLGKTHLSLAIAGQVIEKGYGVVYGSAQNLLGKLEKEKFSFNTQDEDQQSYLSLVQECDLLILDDLGTEFLSQFVTSMLYNIINTRLLEGRPTIISTNLTFQEISKRYTDRLASRLFGGYEQFEFVGRDVRIQSKIRG